jgi:hypothetical protein
MLTPLQTAKHWRHWSQVVAANDWTMEQGRLSAEAQRTAGESIFHKFVWRTAGQLALQAHRAVTAEDLRHACYLVATDRVPGWSTSARPVASMRDLGNREFSRVLVLWALLVNPDDLEAGMAWEHPENSEREGLIASIQKAMPDATARAIAGNAFGTRNWENLDLGQLKWLRRAGGEKQRKWNRPVEPIDQPF